MILFCGIPSEPSLGLVLDEVKRLGTPFLMMNQRRFETVKIEFSLHNGSISGWLAYEENYYRLEDFYAVYNRIMDFRYLPELEKETPDSLKSEHFRIQHDAFIRWCEIANARVVNRSSPMGSNYSKPYQSQMIREHAFLIPETLVTNEPDMVYEFYRKHKKVIYKSICNIRSIVQPLLDEDIKRLNRIRFCPVQFQQFIDGTNVRVHVIGKTAIATSITSEVTDYRYTYMHGKEESLHAMTLENTLYEKCVNLAISLGLDFAGIDLIITPDNQVYCLEVNPSPAFSYYESYTGQPVALAVAKYLAGLSL
jgi:glutathione synthase/RimK-type ligase-like ATP-grasp enzyme